MGLGTHGTSIHGSLGGTSLAACATQQHCRTLDEPLYASPMKLSVTQMDAQRINLQVPMRANCKCFRKSCEKHPSETTADMPPQAACQGSLHRSSSLKLNLPPFRFSRPVCLLQSIPSTRQPCLETLRESRLRWSSAQRHSTA